MTCDQVRASDLVEKYVRGELNDADQNNFEGHYFECPRCLADVEAHWLIRNELERSAVAIEAESIGTAGPRRWRWMAAAASIAALIVIGVVTWNARQPGSGSPGTTSTSSVLASGATSGSASAEPRPPIEPLPPSRAEIVATLARVDPPQYVPLTLRGPDEAAIRFERAMQDYMRGDYAQAAVRLQRAAALAPDAPHVSFFLGISHLMTGRVDDGRAALQRTSRMVDSDYAADAHFYLAKARLAKADVDGARRELNAAIAAGEAERKTEATDLLRKLDALPREK